MTIDRGCLFDHPVLGHRLHNLLFRVVFINKNSVHRPGLVGTIADHHAANAVVTKAVPAVYKILNNIIQHRLNKFFVGIDNPLVCIAL